MHLNAGIHLTRFVLNLAKEAPRNSPSRPCHFASHVTFGTCVVRIQRHRGLAVVFHGCVGWIRRWAAGRCALSACVGAHPGDLCYTCQV